MHYVQVAGKFKNKAAASAYEAWLEFVSTRKTKRHQLNKCMTRFTRTSPSLNCYGNAYSDAHVE